LKPEVKKSANTAPTTAITATKIQSHLIFNIRTL
jgi:hypothetical protein